MSFFNKKEDVMRIELTPHGRNLLMKGKMMPTFYAFFDDDILYDSEAASVTENNTQTKIRITTNTPSIKPASTISGVESSHFNSLSIEDHNVLINPIGTNKISSKNANSWDISLLKGIISSSAGYISSSISPIHNIPQIECEMNFTMSVGNINNEPYINNKYISSEIANDDTFLKIEKDDFLFYILEKNGFLYKNSLSVEVFKYEHDEVNMNRIFFYDEALDKNDVLNTELSIDTQPAEEKHNVANYFNILVDKEISNLDLCEGISKLKDKNIYLGLEIDCEDIEYNEINIYQTDVTDIEDCEI